MKIPIKEVDYGVACCVRDGRKKWIELNKHLKHYPKLYKYILAHEIEHYNSNGLFDFRIELKFMSNLKVGWELFRFSIKHPKAFYDMSPFFYNKKWGVNWFMLLSYLIIFGTAGMIYLI